MMTFRKLHTPCPESIAHLPPWQCISSSLLFYLEQLSKTYKQDIFDVYFKDHYTTIAPQMPSESYNVHCWIGHL